MYRNFADFLYQYHGVMWDEIFSPGHLLQVESCDDNCFVSAHVGCVVGALILNTLVATMKCFIVDLLHPRLGRLGVLPGGL